MRAHCSHYISVGQVKPSAPPYAAGITWYHHCAPRYSNKVVDSRSVIAAVKEAVQVVHVPILLRIKDGDESACGVEGCASVALQRPAVDLISRRAEDSSSTTVGISRTYVAAGFNRGSFGAVRVRDAVFGKVDICLQGQLARFGSSSVAPPVVGIEAKVARVVED